MTRVFVAVVFLSAQNWSDAQENHVDQSRQCVVVLAPDWESRAGILYAFDRSQENGRWRRHGNEIPVVLGSHGMAWGRGLVKTDRLTGPSKREGDRKTPAGVFRLRAAFGYAPQDEARWIKIPYIALTRDSEGVDDPKSKFYNRIVERAKIDKPDWKSSERMFRDDDLYRWGVVIEHNSAPIVPGAGSCIFLHVWRSPNSATVGCIAMAQSELIPLLKWFDPSAKPFLVAAPKNIYPELQRDWKLPDLKER